MTLTTEQLAARSGAHLGGSDMPEVLGMRGSALELYLLKRGEMEPTRDMCRRFEVGHAMEPLVRRWFEEDTGMRVIPPDECGEHLARMGCVVDDSGTLHHPEHEWMVGHLDGLVVEPDGSLVPWEGKTAETFMGREWGESGTDQIPDIYMVQVQPYIAMTRATHAYVAVTVGMSGNDTRWFRVPRSDELIAHLIERGADFVRRILEGDPPDPVTVDEAKMRWPFSVEGEYHEADDDALEALRRIEARKEETKRLKADDDADRLLVLSAIADAEGLQRDGKPVATNKVQRRAEYTAKASEFRVLRITKKNL